MEFGSDAEMDSTPEDEDELGTFGAHRLSRQAKNTLDAFAPQDEREHELERLGTKRPGRKSRNALDALANSDYEEDEVVVVENGVDPRNSPSAGLHDQLLVTGENSDMYDQAITKQSKIEIRLKPVIDAQMYPKFFYDPTVTEVLEEFKERGKWKYVVVKGDGTEEELTLYEITNLPGGLEALSRFQTRAEQEHDEEDSNSPDVIMVNTRTNRISPERPGLIPLKEVDWSEDEDEIIRPTRKRQSKSKSKFERTFRPPEDSFEDDTEESVNSDRILLSKLKSTRRRLDSRLQRNTKGANPNYDDSLPMSPGSDDVMPKKKGRPFSGPRGPVRRSGRERKTGNMREIAEDDIPEAATRADKSLAPKATGAKEAFKKLPSSYAFRQRHIQFCDTCDEGSESSGKGFLIFCQGCSIAYHSGCIGSRSTRDHLVTKIGDQDFVLQCRRCVETARKKDNMASHTGRCATCGSSGPACKPFRPNKTSREEQKERETNGGDDPITSVSRNLINNFSNVLFRCMSCSQAFHWHHLPSKIEEHDMIEKKDDASKAEKRFAEYSDVWLCQDCESAPAEIGALVAWRPKDVNSYQSGQTVDEVPEDKKEYLIKWHEKSYYRSTWMNGSWVWGKISPGTRKAFAKKDNQENLPKMRTEDAIPEDYLRVDIVFDVKYNNKVSVEIEEVDRARIKEVKKAMVKYKGLAYEDVVWEEPPPVEDKERYADFKVAYEDWVRGKYMHVLAPTSLSNNLRKTRSLNFEEKILQNSQPKSLKGGELMPHQQDGLNWLLYKWYSSQNGILADEMGLGKTIQIISFMATLQERFNLAPFLIVVPNATCANWRREIKQWAPELRVATFFGTAVARELAQRYELFPKGDKVLRCHVVVTSYDAAQDANCQRVFNRINWIALVVDEGQRLKNDKNLLYSALCNIKVSFTVLLTGTPIQNNPRELFNLLAFLDKKIDAQKLEDENKELTQEKVEKMHEMLKPFVLRRTKRQTLKDLPPMAQIIVPITMSPLQKKLYKSIIGRNAELLKAIFGGNRTGNVKGLRNILMQLRQCLCHPYVYNQDIEGRTEEASSHRQLVEASAKLQILDMMIPKLRERGHRVLIFSQFLHMLTIMEDFLSGLALEHRRLDGSMGSLEKQKVIDDFNAPDSNIFALLLSTRAGGVGINLATADTVIIMDPDFNPHQDIQAISRAHRLGQQRKVLVFQLMTRMSAEEKILQIGKKKMALDHVLIERLDRDEEDGQDLESVLRYGAKALFDDDITHDIKYDSASVDRLLDRSQVEDTANGEDDSTESSFGFAKIWQNGSLAMAKESTIGDEISTNDIDVWHKIMEERQRQADAAKEKAEQLGRGKRNRKNVDYGVQSAIGLEPDGSYVGDVDVDPDFQVRASSEEDDDQSVEEIVDEELPSAEGGHPEIKQAQQPKSDPQATKPVFKRVKVRQPPSDSRQYDPCLACGDRYGSHPVGECPVKLAGPEYCNLCGQAHYGGPGSCPQLKSEERIRLLIRASDTSPESKELVKLAQKKLKVDLANAVQQKKRKHDAILFNKTNTTGTIRSSNGLNDNGPALKKQANMPGSGYGNLNMQVPPEVTPNGHLAPFGSGHTPIPQYYGCVDGRQSQYGRVQRSSPPNLNILEVREDVQPQNPIGYIQNSPYLNQSLPAMPVSTQPQYPATNTPNGPAAYGKPP